MRGVVAIQHFLDDGPGYEAWLRAHPRGYVVNAHRTPSPEYLKLHRAQCVHITRLLPGSTTWTDGEYREVCADQRVELERWAAGLGGQLETECYCVAT